MGNWGFFYAQDLMSLMLIVVYNETIYTKQLYAWATESLKLLSMNFTTFQISCEIRHNYRICLFEVCLLYKHHVFWKFINWVYYAYGAAVETLNCWVLKWFIKATVAESMAAWNQYSRHWLWFWFIRLFAISAIH